MRAYISVSFSNSHLLKNELSTVKAALVQMHFEPFIFVEQYSYRADQQKQMMAQALTDIDNCDLFIAETSYKAIGVGVEAGYAKARMKPLIYLRHVTAEHSTTVAGISDHEILYENDDDLKQKLLQVLSVYSK